MSIIIFRSSSCHVRIRVGIALRFGGALRAPGPVRCFVRKLTTRSLPGRPPAYVLSRTTPAHKGKHLSGTDVQVSGMEFMPQATPVAPCEAPGCGGGPAGLPRTGSVHGT